MGNIILQFVKVTVIISLSTILLSLLVFSLKERALKRKRMKKKPKDSTS